MLIDDIVSTAQRPKTEFYTGQIYPCIKMISYDADSHELNEEQLSILLTENAVIPFQEKSSAVFEKIKNL